MQSEDVDNESSSEDETADDAPNDRRYPLRTYYVPEIFHTQMVMYHGV